MCIRDSFSPLSLARSAFRTYASASTRSASPCTVGGAATLEHNASVLDIIFIALSNSPSSTCTRAFSTLRITRAGTCYDIRFHAQTVSISFLFPSPAPRDVRLGTPRARVPLDPSHASLPTSPSTRGVSRARDIATQLSFHASSSPSSSQASRVAREGASSRPRREGQRLDGDARARCRAGRARRRETRATSERAPCEDPCRGDRRRRTPWPTRRELRGVERARSGFGGGRVYAGADAGGRDGARMASQGVNGRRIRCLRSIWTRW